MLITYSKFKLFIPLFFSGFSHYQDTFQTGSIIKLMKKKIAWSYSLLYRPAKVQIFELSAKYERDLLCRNPIKRRLSIDVDIFAFKYLWRQWFLRAFALFVDASDVTLCPLALYFSYVNVYTDSQPAELNDINDKAKLVRCVLHLIWTRDSRHPVHYYVLEPKLP